MGFKIYCCYKESKVYAEKHESVSLLFYQDFLTAKAKGIISLDAADKRANPMHSLLLRNFHSRETNQYRDWGK